MGGGGLEVCDHSLGNISEIRLSCCANIQRDRATSGVRTPSFDSSQSVNQAQLTALFHFSTCVKC